MGVPLAAGPIVTQGGVIFFGSGMDRYFRAYDLKTGTELWSDYLPATSQATPMSYVSPRTGRQIVVITVPSAQRRFGMDTGARAETDPLGGYVIAYGIEVNSER